MKRVIIAVTMVLLLTVSSTVSHMTINNRMKKLHGEIKNISQNLPSLSEKDFADIKQLTVNQWSEAEKLLHFFESHDKYEEISNLFGELKITAENSDTDETVKIIIELQNLIEKYLESRKLSLENILIITNQLQ